MEKTKELRGHLEVTCKYFEEALNILRRCECHAETGTADDADQFSSELGQFMQVLDKIEEKSHHLNDMEIPAKILELVDCGGNPNLLFKEWYGFAKMRNDKCRGRHRQLKEFQSLMSQSYPDLSTGTPEKAAAVAEPKSDVETLLANCTGEEDLFAELQLTKSYNKYVLKEPPSVASLFSELKGPAPPNFRQLPPENPNVPFQHSEADQGTLLFDLLRKEPPNKVRIPLLSKQELRDLRFGPGDPLGKIDVSENPITAFKRIKEQLKMREQIKKQAHQKNFIPSSKRQKRS